MTKLPPEDLRLLKLAMRPDPKMPAPGTGPRWRGTAADKVYVAAREELLPFAEERANAQAGSVPAAGEERPVWAARWDAAFHDAMSELWETRGRALERLRGAREQVYVEGLRVRYRFVERGRVPRDVAVIIDRKLIARHRKVLVDELKRLQASTATEERTVLIKEIVE